MNVVYLCPSIKKERLGAEEQDLVATANILRGLPRITVYWLSLDPVTGEIFDHNNGKTLPYSKLKMKNVLLYIKYKLLAFDNASRKPFRLLKFNNLQAFLASQKIDVIITSTNSAVVYGVASKKPHIFRSLNYEPLHALGEVENRIKAIIHSRLKYLSVGLELRADIVWAISPRDLQLYTTHHRASRGTLMMVIPLMQLAENSSYHFEDLYEGQKNQLRVAFLGSSYSVLHNRRGLEKVLKTFSDLSLRDDKSFFVLNVYGRKSDILKTTPPSNVRFNGWIDDVNQIFNENDIFIVPYAGGAGMQAKVFEPLYRGKLLVCDPRTLAGYDFLENQHFLSAASSSELIKQLDWIYENQTECKRIAVSAREKALLLFNRRNLENAITLSFESLGAKYWKK